MLQFLFRPTSHAAIQSAVMLYSKSIAVIFAASFTHSIWAADGIELPKTIAWSAYPTGTGGYSQAVAIGSILQRQYQVNLRVIPAPLCVE